MVSCCTGKENMRKRKQQTRIIIIMAVIIIGLIGGGCYLYSSNKDLEKTKVTLEKKVSENTQTVYVATRLIERGEKLISEGDDANVEKQQVSTGLESFNYITDTEIGNVAVVDISQGVPIMYSMVTDITVAADTRNYEIAVANLMTTQKENDYVDVRITFPNGEDYIILPKKQVMSLNLETCVFDSYLNEEEILRMTSAIVDAYTTTGCRIYTTKYVESNLQEEAIPNYPVKSTTLDLINSDPNILTKAVETLNLEARLSLEERIGQMTQEEKDAVEDGFEQMPVPAKEEESNDSVEGDTDTGDDVAAGEE